MDTSISTEKFCLRWNDFESNISNAIREIREDKDLFDCTLSCGTKQVQAHKLILSACSPFFKAVFKQNPHNHPLLYLKGISFDDLVAILQFIYHGEVNVSQDDLNPFLAVAEDLKIKGLTQNSSEDRKSPAPKNKIVKQQSQIPSVNLPPPPPLKLPPKQAISNPAIKPISQLHTNDDDDIQEVEPEVKSEPGSSRLGVMQQYSHGDTEDMNPMSYDESYDYGEYGGEGDMYAGHIIDTVDQDKDPGELVEQYTDNTVFPVMEKFRCCVCGKVFNDRSNCRRHVKSFHFEEEQVSCQNCGKFYKNKRSAQAHYQLCIKSIAN